MRYAKDGGSLLIKEGLSILGFHEIRNLIALFVGEPGSSQCRLAMASQTYPSAM